jgi:hypothetical protein
MGQRKKDIFLDEINGIPIVPRYKYLGTWWSSMKNFSEQIQKT